MGGAAEEDARNAMETFLRNSIHLYVDNGNGRPQLAPIATTGTVKTGEYATEWVIDYRYAEITLEEGKTVVTFRNTGEDNSALNLGSGVTYYFEIQANTICDTSDARNTMGTTRLDEFTTVFAQVNLSVVNTSTIHHITAWQ